MMDALKTPGRLLKRLRSRLKRDTRGVAMVDFALMTPLLVALTMGGIEIGRFALLNQKLSRVATNTSDLVSQAEFLTEDDVAQVFVASEFSMKPFQLGGDGLIIVTSVSTGDDPNDPQINWQRSGGGAAIIGSQIGSPGGPATLPNGYQMKANRNIIISEVYYNYAPFLFSGATSPRTLEHFAVYRPRLGALSQVLP